MDFINAFLLILRYSCTDIWVSWVTKDIQSEMQMNLLYLYDVMGTLSIDFLYSC